MVSGLQLSGTSLWEQKTAPELLPISFDFPQRFAVAFAFVIFKWNNIDPVAPCWNNCLATVFIHAKFIHIIPASVS